MHALTAMIQDSATLRILNRLYSLSLPIYAEQHWMLSPQFKAEAVQIVLATARPIAEVARDLGINHRMFENR